MANKDLEDEQQRESGSSPLPSYGLSRLVDIGNSETVQSMLQGITQGNLSLKNMQKASANDDHDEGELTSRGSGSSTEEGLTSRECGSSTEEGSSSLEEGTENIIVLAQDQHGNIRIPDPGSTGEGNMVQNENSYVLQYFDLGNTEVIQNPNRLNLDYQQIQGDDEALFGEGVAMEVTVEDNFAGFLDPKVTFEEMAHYSRYRYESERSKTPRSSKNKISDPADDYKSLGIVKVEGYHGNARLVIYCVDAYGNIHPYSLHGEHCKDGIYQRVLNLTSDYPVRLKKVTITTPKAKEYKKIFANRKEVLRQYHLDVDNMNYANMNKMDKNTVYLRAEVILDDTTTMKSAISTAIHNKKEGSEFKIYTIEPASAPATGKHAGNPNKNRVLIVLTDETAFPKNISVMIKSVTGGPWERKVSKNDVNVIRKSVVEFLPPQYRYPDTETNEEMEVYLVDEDTKEESNHVKFVYHSVKDQEGLEERKRKKPKLSHTAWQSFKIPLQNSGGKSTMSYAESLLVLPQPNVETNFNGKVVSLKDTSQTEDYAMCSSNALTEQQSSGGTEQSQLTVSFPTPQFYMPVTSYSSASALDPLSGVVVTSACSTATSVYTSVESTISYPPKVFSESGLTQTSASPVQTRLGEQLQDTSNDQVQITLQQIILQRIQQKQHSQTEKQQLQLLLQSVVQQEQQEKEEQHHRLKGQQEQPFEQAQQQERQQQVDQRQSGHTSEQINQLQGYRRQDGSVLEQVNTQQSYQRSDGSALDQVYPQPVYQRQDGHTLDQVNPQQGYQRQDGHASDQVNSQLGYQRQDGHVSDQVNSQQHTQVNTINEKLLQQQFISSVLEAQAKKLDPNFKLPPNQMFLMLGEKMVIADKSLMNQLFGQSGQDPTLQPQGANQVSNQFQTSHAQGTSRSEPPGVTSQLFGRSNDNQIQSRPQMTQPYAPYQNTGTRVASGAENQPQNLSNLPFQQYFEYSNQTPASAGFQPGYSGGHRNLLTQGSNQSRQSIFPRNNLPFSPANLDDDDLETDSSGLKRKNPVQMYGKTSAKAPNCSDESKSSPGMNKQGVIDLTTGNSSPNSVINIDDEDDDDDLEIDYVEDSSVEYNIPFTVLSESERDLQGVETMKGKSSQRQVNKSKCLEDSGIYVDDSS